MRRQLTRVTSVLLSGFVIASLCSAQLSKNSKWIKSLKDKYDVEYDIVYCPVDSVVDRLDVYVPKSALGPVPILMWIHGGGWTHGSKDSVSGPLLPFLSMGWTVVNVEYRFASVALAPAAVEDCRSALRWIYSNSKNIKADTKKIVVGGTSSGGHLALMTGMLPPGTSLDTLAAGSEELKVAAILDNYGITDVVDLLGGANKRGYAMKWIGKQPNAEEIAKIVSPITYVRAGLPAILIIQGDADPTVPYSHSVRLHEALDKAGVVNELKTIPGGVHGKFTKEQNKEIQDKVLEFLQKAGIVAVK